ncbi:MAG: hypothetical protein KatS3mg014_2508 [Actinomycetota bacterium]|nr:MAG: hypothetical protein KatS3mg014_2497 [Actinomycetota bacterium]GIV00893.1 MAG: hypothetical protein KatS3mg014_2508 [Actinomycetota bacterium]
MDALTEVLDTVAAMAADEAVVAAMRARGRVGPDGELLDEELVARMLGNPLAAELDAIREAAAAEARQRALKELAPWLEGRQPLMLPTYLRPEPDPADDVPEVVGGRRLHRLGPGHLVLWLMAAAQGAVDVSRLATAVSCRVVRLAVQAGGDPEALAGILDAECVAWWADLGVTARVVDPAAADAWLRRVPRPVRLLAVVGRARFEQAVQGLL